MKISVTIGKANQSTKSNFVHNNREGIEPTYLLPKDKRTTTFGTEKKPTWCSINANAASKLLDEQFSERSKFYENRRGRKLHAQTRKQLSVVVGVSDYENISDAHKALELAVSAVEKKFNTSAIQIAFHADEGHVNSAGITRLNYHAHLEFCNLNKQGESINKKCNKYFLSDLQKKACEAAGADYKRFTLSTSRRNIAHAAYRAKKEDEKLKAKIKDITAANTNARNELKNSLNASQKDYQNLKKLTDSLKEQVREKNITKSDMEKKYSEFFELRNTIPKPAQQRVEQTKTALNTTSKKAVEDLANTLEKTEIYAQSLEKKIKETGEYLEEFADSLKAQARTNESNKKTNETNKQNLHFDVSENEKLLRQINELKEYISILESKNLKFMTAERESLDYNDDVVAAVRAAEARVSQKDKRPLSEALNDAQRGFAASEELEQEAERERERENYKHNSNSNNSRRF